MSELGDLQLSKLRFYSIGQVAENKALGSAVIQVTPLEDSGFADGDVTGKISTGYSSGQGINTGGYSASVNASAAISATWLPLSDANRLTAPDVRRGEMVVIYQFGDQNKFWWCTLKDDHHLRRLETVVYGISAIQTEGVPLNADNMYWFEWSTHKKVIHLHTSKANGEPFAFDIQIDSGNGAITIMDDIGNTIQLNSKEHRIELLNTDGSHYDMHGRNLTITIPDTTHLITKDFLVDASNSMVVNATVHYRLQTVDSAMTATSSFTTTSPTTTVTAGGSFTVSGGSVDISGSDSSMTGSSSATVASPATTII